MGILFVDPCFSFISMFEVKYPMLIKSMFWIISTLVVIIKYIIQAIYLF